jgi:hypothetical protein
MHCFFHYVGSGGFMVLTSNDAVWNIHLQSVLFIYLLL